MRSSFAVLAAEGRRRVNAFDSRAQDDAATEPGRGRAADDTRKRYGTAQNTETTNESAKQTALLEEMLGILGALADIFK